MASQTQPPDQSISKTKGLTYWSSTPSSDDAMLGGVPSHPGFHSVLRIDLQGSRTFLARLGIGIKSGRKKLDTVLEGGAGIGRVTKGLLCEIASHVDIIEPVSKFTAPLATHSGIRNIYNVGLEDWHPQPDLDAETDAETASTLLYDLIWVQWCVGHLTDAQLVSFLQRCSLALRSPDGVIVVKENLSTSGGDYFDEEDSSVTREDEKFRALFARAGLVIVKTDLQRGFPESATRRLLPVRMYALKPKADK